MGHWPHFVVRFGPSSVSIETDVEFVRSYFCSTKGHLIKLTQLPTGHIIFHDIPGWEHVNRSLQSNKNSSECAKWCWFWLSTITTILPGPLLSQLICYHIRCFLPREAGEVGRNLGYPQSIHTERKAIKALAACLEQAKRVQHKPENGLGLC